MSYSNKIEGKFIEIIKLFEEIAYKHTIINEKGNNNKKKRLWQSRE